MKRPRSSEVYSLLEKEFPDACCELFHEGPFQLLIATILSAQCTDIQVNKVTPMLFKKFPDAFSLAQADLTLVENLVRSTNFYRNKAKNIVACSQELIEKHNGIVPEKLEQLIKLPGVGRKTANVVLSNAFGQHEGVVVDTHVKRISRLLRLTNHEEPEKIEYDLMKLFPQKHWGQLSHLLIFLGRRTCKAKKPLCSSCCLSKICPSKI